MPYRGILRCRGCPASGTRRRGTEEAQAVDQRHIRFCRSGDNALFQTADHFVDHRDHHAGDNLFLAEIALRLAHFCQQVVNDDIFFFLRLTFAVFFITPETEAVLLTKAVGIKQRVDGIAIIFLHPLRKPAAMTA